MCISGNTQSTSFFFGKFLKKLVYDQCSSITKGSIFHIKHMYIQTFSMEVDWPEICSVIEVSTMFYICTYCIFTLYGKAATGWQFDYFRGPVTYWNKCSHYCIVIMQKGTYCKLQIMRICLYLSEACTGGSHDWWPFLVQKSFDLSLSPPYNVMHRIWSREFIG